jgi:hypothetical protein
MQLYVVAGVLPPLSFILLMNRIPNAQLIEVDKALLETRPPRLGLDLPPGLALTIRRRTDVTDMMAAALASEDGVTTAAAVDAGVNGTGGSNLWVGEVEGADGPFSAVVFVVADDNTVHGNIRFYDKKTRKIRSFRVSDSVSSVMNAVMLLLKERGVSLTLRTLEVSGELLTSLSLSLSCC